MRQLTVPDSNIVATVTADRYSREFFGWYIRLAWLDEGTEIHEAWFPASMFGA